MNLRDMQASIAETYKKRGYTNDLPTLALGLCEEAGEVGKAVNVKYNPKYVARVRIDDHEEDNLEHELCDALVYLLGIANSAGIDLETEFIARKVS